MSKTFLEINTQLIFLRAIEFRGPKLSFFLNCLSHFPFVHLVCHLVIHFGRLWVKGKTC